MSIECYNDINIHVHHYKNVPKKHALFSFRLNKHTILSKKCSFFSRKMGGEGKTFYSMFNVNMNIARPLSR